MNKKILFAAVGSALAASPMIAAADVSVGGHAQVEYYNGETAASGSTTLKYNGLIDNARGRFWINSSEDLGGGMKAMARYEFSVDTANSGQSAANGNGSVGLDTGTRTIDQRTREKYVGLAGGFGTVTAGNLHGVYKRMGGVRWDPVNATVLEARSNGGQSGSGDANATFAHNGFIPGAVKWESGAVTGPVAIEVLIAPNKSTNAAGTDAADGTDTQFGASFKPIPGLEVIAVIANNKQTPSTTNTAQKATKFGARYSMGPHTFWGQIEDVDAPSGAAVTTYALTAGTTMADSTGITSATKGELKYNWFGYSLKAGNNLFVAQYANSSRAADGAVDVDVTFLSLAVLHSLSKSTTLHVGYRKTELEQGATTREQTVFAGGMRVNF